MGKQKKGVQDRMRSGRERQRDGGRGRSHFHSLVHLFTHFFVLCLLGLNVIFIG